MHKPIEVIFLNQAEDFVDSLEYKARRKLFQAIRKTKERLFGDWFKKIKDSDGIFEFCVDENGKFYRLFTFWDTEYPEETLIIGTHGLIKKSNKTPKEDIRKAEQIKREYFEEKKIKKDKKQVDNGRKRI